MLAMEEILCELNREDTNEQGLPPGFRFHPTDEELITFYLASKVFNGTYSFGIHIAEVDLNRCEPWELPDVAKMGEREWYFFSLRDRKYPTGLRTNRATGAGYWKATGKDREVYSTAATNGSSVLLGMKKTLVFYKGRAPRGEKTKWVMHEYRLAGDFSYRNYSSKEEWVICRILHKIGEKKHPIYQAAGQNYGYTTLKTWPSASSSLVNTAAVPLVETTAPNPKTLLQESFQISQNSVQSLHNFYLLHPQENDLMKSLFNNISQTNRFPMDIGSVLSSTSFSTSQSTINSAPTTKRHKENKQEICTSSKENQLVPLIQYPKIEEGNFFQCQPNSSTNCYNQNSMPTAYGVNISDWGLVGMDQGMMMEDHMACPIKITAESWPLDL